MKDRLNGMRVFAQVVEAKSFSAAADKLGMSKSLASRHVSALEHSLSVKLLNRSTRKLSLTEGGALFYEHCARIVQEAELAEQRLTRVQSEPAGLVKVTAVPAFAIRHVLPALTTSIRSIRRSRSSCSAATARSSWAMRDSTLASACRSLQPPIWSRESSPSTGRCCAPHPHTSNGTGCRVGSRISASTSACCFRRLRPRECGRSGGTGGSIR